MNWDEKCQRGCQSGFNYELKKTIPRIFFWQGGLRLLESCDKLAMQTEYKCILQQMRLKLHIPKAKHDNWNMFFIATWKLTDWSTFTSYHSLSQLWILKRSFDWTWNRKMSKVPTFSNCFTANVYVKTENQNFKLEKQSASPKMTYFSRCFIGNALHSNFLKFMEIFSENYLHIQQKTPNMRFN